MQIGTNIDGIRDYSAAQQFSDCFRMARAFGSPTAVFDQKAAVGLDGLPIGDFGTVIHTGVTPVGGIYKLSFTGKADLSTPASQAEIENLLYDAVKNTTTADINLSENSQLFLSFKNTNGNLKNLSLIRPGCTKEQLFNPKFVESCKPYKVIRFMDWLHTNDSTLKTWADRKLPSELLQSGNRGACLEYAIELCNQTGCDGWFNIPHMADDDFVLKMAQLLKDKLKPELKVYVEYSNEVWNSIFSQSKWNVDQAQVDLSAGQTDLQDGPTDVNIFYWGRRRIAKRVVLIGKMFKTILGSERVRPVLANQSADPSIARAQLAYIKKYYQMPDIWGVGIAPYFATQNDDLPGASLQTIAEGLVGSVKSNVAKWIPQAWDGKTLGTNLPTVATLTSYYGLKLCFYECGQHMLPGKGNLTAEDLDMKIQNTQEMGDAYAAYFAGMEGVVELACHFVHMGLWNKYGYWGLTQSYNLDTPKLKAVLAACQRFHGSELDQLKAQLASLKLQLTDLSDKLKKSVSDLAASDLLNQNLKKEISALTLEKQTLQSKIDRALVSVDQAKLDLS